MGSTVPIDLLVYRHATIHTRKIVVVVAILIAVQSGLNQIIDIYNEHFVP